MQYGGSMKTKFILGALGLVVVAFLVLMADMLVTGVDKDIVVREDSTRREAQSTSEDGDKFKIYLITMDQGSNYWKFLDAGCRQAAKELRCVRYRWISAVTLTVDGQRECIDRAVMEGAQAILISAASKTELDDNLRAAKEAGVRIIYVDSSASEPATATLMTNSEQAGKVAGKTMMKALADAGISSGTIGVAAIRPNVPNATLRDKGFRSVFEGSSFTVAPTFYMRENRQNIKDEVRVRPDYVGFFGSNEQTTQAIGEQVKESHSRQIVIGFDTSDYTLSMIKEGVIYATMQQNPQRMGHDGVVIAVRALKNEPLGVDSIIDTGVAVVTRDQI